MIETSPAQSILANAAAYRRARAWRGAAFVLLVPGAGIAIGILNPPGSWYAALNKPAFNPPDWVFAPVWTVLFVMIAIAGLRTFEQSPRGVAMRLWLVQLALNFAWSPIFFFLHRIDVALAVILTMLATIVAFVGRQWQEDRVAALLFIPYAAWVAFATTLNTALLLLNS